MDKIGLRERILGKVSSISRAGEDWETSLFAGWPQEITPSDARKIAHWMTNDADCEWGYDPRHQTVAEIIREEAAHA